jgi:hypothetical protein
LLRRAKVAATDEKVKAPLEEGRDEEETLVLALVDLRGTETEATLSLETIPQTEAMTRTATNRNAVNDGSVRPPTTALPVLKVASKVALHGNMTCFLPHNLARFPAQIWPT